MSDDTRTERRPPRTGGGTPGAPSGKANPPPKPKQTDSKANEPGRVARNDTNLLDLPITRMRIGWIHTITSAVTRYRLWVPTDSGGVLTITGPKSGTVDLRRPFANVIKQPDKTVTYEVKTGEFGEFFVIARGKENESVQARFVQTSFSRDGTSESDPPLVPWNFWFWPSADSPGNQFSGQAGDVMSRYGKAFNHNPDACRATEKADHSTPPPKGGGFDWQGHCHQGAAASAMFEEPQAATINNQTFTSEEMKYLAAEYYGNFGNTELAWELKRGTLLGGMYYLPAFFKPGEPATRSVFVDRLKHMFRLPTESPDDPKLAKFAEDNADAYLKSVGGEDAMQKLVIQQMGELAAEFYQALIESMRVKKHPLNSNVRSYSHNGGPEEVWNHVLFWYSAHYSETSWHDRYEPAAPGKPPKVEPADDTDMDIYCEIRVNRDFHLHGVSTGNPARISGNQMTPDDVRSLLFKHTWRIKFNDDTGKIDVKDKRNRWVSIRGDDAQALYAPTKLLTMTKLSNVRLQGDKHSLGNKFVKTELAKGGWLKVRKRYQ